MESGGDGNGGGREARGATTKRVADWHEVTPRRRHKMGPTWDEMMAETIEREEPDGQPKVPN